VRGTLYFSFKNNNYFPKILRLETGKSKSFDGKRDTFDAFFSSFPYVETRNQMITLRINDFINRRIFPVQVPSEGTILDVKKEIFQQLFIGIANQRLVLTKYQLLNDLSLKDLHIDDGSQLLFCVSPFCFYLKLVGKIDNRIYFQEAIPLISDLYREVQRLLPAAKSIQLYWSGLRLENASKPLNKFFDLKSGASIQVIAK
jgi:hypothetical protein